MADLLAYYNGAYGKGTAWATAFPYSGAEAGYFVLPTDYEQYAVSSIQVPCINALSSVGAFLTYDITCTIRTGLYGGFAGTGTIIGTATPISNAGFPTQVSGNRDYTGASLIEFEFSPTVTLSRNTGYHVVLSAPYDTTYPYPGHAAWVCDEPVYGGTSLGSGTGSTLSYVTSQNQWQSFITRRWANLFVYGLAVDPNPPSDPPSDLITYPPTRPDAYDPDVIWQPGEWTDPTTYVPGEWGAGYVATGGGRWGQNLVVAGNKKIYYEPHEGV